MAHATEIKAARQLGYGEIDAQASAFAALDETYNAVLDPDRPLITLGKRVIYT